MAFVAIPNTGQIVLNWNSSSGGGVNVLHFRVAPLFTFNLASANGISAAWSAGRNVAGGFRQYQHPTIVYTGLTIRDIRTPFQPAIASTPVVEAGTSASGQMPNEVAVVTTLRTALAGRRFRGRMYHFGFTNNAVDASNQIAAPVVTAIQLSMNAFINAMAANTTPLGVASKVAVALSDVTSVFTNNTWDTQRGRGIP